MMITSNSLLSFILSNFVKAVNGKGKANAVKASPPCLMISRLVILLLILYIFWKRVFKLYVIIKHILFIILQQAFFQIGNHLFLINVLPDKDHLVHSVSPLPAPPLFYRDLIVSKGGVLQSCLERRTAPASACSFSAGRTTCLRTINCIIGT